MPPSVYAPGMMDFQDVANRFAWLMASPRGALVYCPYLVVVGVLLITCRKHLSDAGLLLPAGLAIAGHTLLLVGFKGWHANWAYGPRPTTATCSRGSCCSRRWACKDSPRFRVVRGRSPARSRSRRASRGAASCIPGVRPRRPRGTGTTGRGALGDEGAVKDWHHPQFLAGLTFEVNPDGTVTEK